jgi:hypothetical protein
MCFVLLNPSTANEVVDDPTIKRCIAFARRRGFGGLEIVNLYAYRATDPADLRRAGYPIGRDNDEHIAEAAQECDAVVLAWGAHAAARERARQVLELLHGLGIGPYCLRVTASGHPEHPLRLPAGCGLRAFEAEVGKVENSGNQVAA